MKKILISLFLANCMWQSAAWSMERSSENVSEGVTVIDTLKLATFPITRALCQGISQGGGSYLDMRPLFVLAMPGALMGDAALAVGGLAATPVVGAKQLFNLFSQAFCDWLSDEGSANLDEVSKSALRGYQKRLLDVLQILDDKSISLSHLSMLILAETAWDSRSSAPKALILGTGEKISKDSLKGAPEAWRKLFRALTSASSMTMSYSSKEKLIVELADWLQKPEKERGASLEGLAETLEVAAKTMQEIMESLNKQAQ